MYNLLVSGLVEDNLSSAIGIERGRFLEYTDNSIRSQLDNLSEEANDCLKSWPCVLMQEGRGESIVHVVQITSVQGNSGRIKLVLSPISCSKVLINDALWKLREELDIAEFEFSRNHWAVKDRDLFPILNNAGYLFEDSDMGKFEDKRLPAPSRRELLQSRDVIGNWSHTEIDDFLLEAGVTGLEASRAIGSRQDRANVIIEFAFANPQATTAENSLFTVFIVHASKSAVDTNGALTSFSADLNVDPREQQTHTSGRDPNRVFVVHGQNEATRAAVVTELNRLGLEAIVLHEQPNMGRHLLTKFIDEAELVTFAVVLMTDDDVGSIKDGTLGPRARQNVILELGYFIAHLGQSKVCALISPDLETPSDFDGIGYIRMDDGGRWQAELARELRAAGMPIVKV